MRNKKIWLFFVLVIAAALAWFFMKGRAEQNPSADIVEEIMPSLGSIRNFISCTGTVLPKNRLEIKPPVSGRVDKVFVKEGEKVTVGQVLAVMSSTERAALIDAARGKGEETLKYWEEAYKSISLNAPIDGEVIVATTQPGQTVTTSDAVIVLSDRLIVRAQVDETDIGKIYENMKAVITLDAYPDTKIKAGVEHIYYESKTVNNVTVYEVDLLPEEVPPFFRSGMNASVDFIIQDKSDILTIPAAAVHKNKENYVLVKQPNGAIVKTPVEVGITDDKNIEIVSGVTENDRIIIQAKKYSVPKAEAAGKNPFLPSRRR